MIIAARSSSPTATTYFLLDQPQHTKRLQPYQSASDSGTSYLDMTNSPADVRKELEKNYMYISRGYLNESDNTDFKKKVMKVIESDRRSAVSDLDAKRFKELLGAHKNDNEDSTRSFHNRPLTPRVSKPNLKWDARQSKQTSTHGNLIYPWYLPTADCLSAFLETKYRYVCERYQNMGGVLNPHDETLSHKVTERAKATAKETVSVMFYSGNAFSNVVIKERKNARDLVLLRISSICQSITAKPFTRKTSKDLEHEIKDSAKPVEAAKVRLQDWAVSVGIRDGKLLDHHNSRLDETKRASIIRMALESLKTLLDEVGHASSSSKLPTRRPTAKPDLWPIMESQFKRIPSIDNNIRVLGLLGNDFGNVDHILSPCEREHRGKADAERKGAQPDDHNTCADFVEGT
ncbi:MAG: hypothetical protein Q9226_005349, partial [Calogaya cf. arnoldii]